MFKTIEYITEAILDPVEYRRSLDEQYRFIRTNEGRLLYDVLQVTKRLWDTYSLMKEELESIDFTNHPGDVIPASSLTRVAVNILYYLQELRKLLPGAEGVDILITVDEKGSLFTDDETTPRDAEQRLSVLLFEFERRNARIAKILHTLLAVKRDMLYPAVMGLKKRGRNFAPEAELTWPMLVPLTSKLIRAIRRTGSVDSSVPEPGSNKEELLNWHPTIPAAKPVQPVKKQALNSFELNQGERKRIAAGSGHAQESQLESPVTDHE